MKKAGSGIQDENRRKERHLANEKGKSLEKGMRHSRANAPRKKRADG
jgi:hypothetical protein